MLPLPDVLPPFTLYTNFSPPGLSSSNGGNENAKAFKR